MTTISSLIRRLLLHGSRDGDDGGEGWERIPIWPPNVFAIAANLVERSGAYRHVIGPSTGPEPTDDLGIFSPEWRAAMSERAEAWAWGLLDDRIGPVWDDHIKYLQSKSYFDPKLLDVSLDQLHDDWAALIDPARYGDADILPHEMIEPGGYDRSRPVPGWWGHALRLLVTADTASHGVGFMPRLVETEQGGRKIVTQGEPTWVQYVVIEQVASRLMRAMANESDQDVGYVYTITDKLFNEALGAVLPKTRTSTLGCTLRSLSHNLALVPSAGQVQARWRVSGVRPIEATSKPGKGGVQKPLNLLLIPFPYRIPADSFSGTPRREKGAEKDNLWGYFQIAQKWLPPQTQEGDTQSRRDKLNEFGNFVANLVRTAAKSGREVNGVVFPEFSLDAEAFNIVAEQLKDDAERTGHTGFEFIIAGTSQEPVPGPKAAAAGADGPRHGNFAAFLGLPRQAEDGKYVDAHVWGLRGAREKHHRWKLTKGQIRRYALSGYLDADTNWWEGIPISPRIVEFFEVRGGTSLTVLICEDLARSDPCQAVVRAIGPNLVIALLMDGPQRAFRWPAHYAGVLADDPGSSVLTLTSLGLIERSAATDPAQNRSIAFFKDSSGFESELPLPIDAHALLLSLEAERKEEHTLDGRGDDGAAYVWRFGEVTPIRARANCLKDWILGLE